MPKKCKVQYVKLSEETKKEIEQAKKEIAQGKFHTHEEVKKKLGSECILSFIRPSRLCNKIKVGHRGNVYETV